MARPPDKGSFPLDHFHECDKFADLYMRCLDKHELMPKRCRQPQIDYLNCRMDKGLMEKEEIKTLGYLDQNSWENEDQEKKFLFEKIQKLKEESWASALQQAQRMKKQQKPKPPQPQMPE